jgi:hypothetical protein
MSDSVQIAIITSIGPTVVGLVGCWISYLNRQKIDRVEKATNGMKHELLEVTRVEAHARGVKEQKEKTSNE